MSEPMTSETANVVVVVRMATDLHHVLGRAAAGYWGVAAFLIVASVVDLLDHAWFSGIFSALAATSFALMGRDSWTRRRKYAAFVRTTEETPR